MTSWPVQHSVTALDGVLPLRPGLRELGPCTLQSRWQTRLPGAARVDLRDWLHPVARDWERHLAGHLAAQTQRCLLVAHSLGCLLVARHLERHGPGGVAGAFLVAPPDPKHDAFPSAISGFSELPRSPLGVPAIVVSSASDPYADPAFGAFCATCWQARHVTAGAAGHINTDSGHGEWDSGYDLLTSFAREVTGH